MRSIAKRIVGGAMRAVAQSGLRSPIPCADRKSTRLNSSHSQISYAVFCLKKKIRQKLNFDVAVQQAHPTCPDLPFDIQVHSIATSLLIVLLCALRSLILYNEIYDSAYFA